MCVHVCVHNYVGEHLDLCVFVCVCVCVRLRKYVFVHFSVVGVW